ncbi:MAG: hypothetical protein HZA48_06170 [Planctomycetes bacterium]|nr:hypothetical protein [Planctomycetota bacterium]
MQKRFLCFALFVLILFGWLIYHEAPMQKQDAGNIAVPQSLIDGIYDADMTVEEIRGQFPQFSQLFARNNSEGFILSDINVSTGKPAVKGIKPKFSIQPPQADSGAYYQNVITPFMPFSYKDEQEITLERYSLQDSGAEPVPVVSAKVMLRPVKAGDAALLYGVNNFVYKGAYRDTDVVYNVSRNSIEEMMYLKSPKAPKAFLFRITKTENISGVRQEGNRIEFINNSGGAELFIKAPYLVDSKGTGRNADIKLIGSDIIALSFDPAGLIYPVLLDPSWASTPNLAVQRQRHCATLLQTGKVLVSGGYSGSTFLSSCEIYDPYTNTWAVTGSMSYARSYHTATLLPNGFVLVAGGYNGTNYLFTAELYNPFTGQWSATGIMNSARVSHTATLLTYSGAQTVLAVGGFDGTSYLTSSERYNYTTGIWTTGNNLVTARYRHTATLLQNGNVVVIGGYNGNTISSSEIFNINTGTWQVTVEALDTPRFDHIATLLPNSTVLVTGGYDNTSYLSSVRIFSPSTQAWSMTADLPSARSGHTAILLPSGNVIIIGGFSGTGFPVATDIFNYSTTAWSVGNSLSVGRMNATATLLHTGDILVAGGLGSGTLNSSELYNSFNGGTWTSAQSMFWGTNDQETQLASAKLLSTGEVLVISGQNDIGYTVESGLYNILDSWTGSDTVSTGRQDFRANLLTSGNVMISGGYNSPSFINAAELYTGGNWGTAGSMNTGRSLCSATLLNNGTILVAGGTTGSTNLETCELYTSPSTWVLTGSMTYGRSRHTATLLNNGEVLAAGGENGSFTCEIYDPATAVWTQTSSMSVTRINHTATKLLNGKVLVAGGNNGATALSTAEIFDPNTAAWTTTGSMSIARETHTATLLSNGYVLVVGGLAGTPTASCEVYNPYRGEWLPATSMAGIRTNHMGVLLPNGTVFIAGGFNGTSTLSTCLLFNMGLGYQAGWQPSVTTSPASGDPGAEITISGTDFRGIAESGSNASNQATNYPLVVLHSVESERQYVLAVTDWSDITVSCLVPSPSTIEPGYYIGWVVVNGIPSTGFMFQREIPADVVIGLNGPTFIFGATTGESNPPTQTLVVRNYGTGTLSWAIANETAAWLDPTPTSGASLAETDPSSIDLAVNISGLPAGSYPTTFDITGATPTRSIDILLTVNPSRPAVTSSSPVINLQPSALSFITPAGDNPASQSFTISNAGGGLLNWYAMDDAAWLSVSPSNGVVSSEQTAVSVSIDATNLVQGTYTALVTINAKETGVPATTIPVTLNVTAPLNPPMIGRSPANMTFYTTETGTNPDYLILSIWNDGGDTLNWIVESSQVWLDIDPPNGSSTGEIDTCIISVDAYDIPDGIYSADISISDIYAGNSPQVTTVTLNVNYPGDKTAPTPPALESPLNNALTYNTKPIFIWGESTDASVITYELQIDNNSDFASPELDITMLTEKTYTPVVSLNYGVYYWRVRAVDEVNNVGSWSVPWVFNLSSSGKNIDITIEEPQPTDTTPQSAGSAGKACFIQEILRPRRK